MDWDDARVFLAVIRHGTLRAAGRALGLSQPTVGRRLARFEAAVGAEPLFDRLPDGLRPRPAGTAMVPLAEQLESAAMALQRRHAGSVEPAGSVRISVGEWAGRFLASHLTDPSDPERLPAAVTVELVQSDQTASLSRRAADLAVRHGRPETGALYVSRIGSIACAVYRSPDAAAAAGDWITYSEEQSHYAATRWTVERALAEGGRVAVRATDMALQTAAARGGAGHVVLPCFIGDLDRKLLRIAGPIAELDAVHWMIVHRDLRRVPRIRAAMTRIRQLFERHRDLLEGRPPSGPVR